MNLKLFKLNSPGGELLYFSNRRVARRARDNFVDSGFYTVVMRGPDHWRGESFNISSKTKKTGKRKRRR